MPIFKVSLAAARRILKMGTLPVPIFNIQGSVNWIYPVSLQKGGKGKKKIHCNG